MFKFAHALLLTALMFAGATMAQAQCFYQSNNPSLIVSPTAVAVDDLQEQTYVLDLDDQDQLIGPQCQANCAVFARQFCFRQETVSDAYAPSVSERFMDISPPGFTCVTLKPPGCGVSHATIAVLIRSDREGITPAHRYQYRTTVRATTNVNDPILANAVYVYNRHDPYSSTCQFQAQP